MHNMNRSHNMKVGKCNTFELNNRVDECSSYTEEEEMRMREVAEELNLTLTETAHETTRGEVHIFRFKGRVSADFLLGALCYARVRIVPPGITKVLGLGGAVPASFYE